MNHHLLILNLRSRGLYKQRKFITGHYWHKPKWCKSWQGSSLKTSSGKWLDWSGDGCGVVSGYLGLELLWLRDQHRKGRCCLEHRGRRRNPFASLFFYHVLWLLSVLPVFQTIWEELLSWEQERTEEERRMKQWVISSSGSIMPESCVLMFSERMVTL